MIETIWWRSLRDVGPWFVVQALLPGATLFALLLWLSHCFVREGFHHVRQYAFAPDAGKSSLTAFAPRSWWSCTCTGFRGCMSTFGCRLRRCCWRLVEHADVWLESAK
jgi:hypothetical protein